MRGRTLAIGLLAVVASFSTAVPVRADSVFGMSYFGSPAETFDARIAGRGGMGLAYRDSLNAAVMQATQLTDLVRVTVGVSNVFERRGSEDASGSLTRFGLSTPTLRIGFPIPGGGGFGVGYEARRSTQWQLARSFETSSAIAIDETIEREGTQFAIPVLFGWRFSDNVVVGGGFHLERGTIRLRFEQGVQESGFIDPSEVREDVFQGVAPELSLALQDIGPVSVAGFWRGGYDADVDIRQRGVALSNREDGTRTDSMPGRFGIGARMALSEDWSAGVDYRLERWSDYEGRSFTYDDQGVYDPNGTSQELQDELEWALGVERASRRDGLRFTTPLRLGAYWRKWHYQLGGNDLTEWGVTLGSGLSLRAGWARTDFSVGYSQIGSTSDNGVSESMLRFTLSVTGGERWYQMR